MNAVADDYLLQRATDVRALLNYTRNTGVRPVNYTFDPPPGVPRNSGTGADRRRSGLAAPATWYIEIGWERPIPWPSTHGTGGTGTRSKRQHRQPC